MEQWNRDYIALLTRQWDDAMARTDNFCAEIRSKDAVDKHAEQDVAAFDQGMGGSAQRVEKTLDCIRNRGYLGADMEALDIGGGTGIFTIPFARHYARVMTLDISPAMQDVIRSRAKAQGLNNIEYRIQNWHTADLEQAGLAQRYDLVLSSINCRGVCSYETLNKMNQASRGGCCLLTWAGRSVSRHTKALQKLILGRTLGTAGGNDIYFPFSLIYHMGGEPDLNYSTIAWERKLTPEGAVGGICRNYWRFAEITEDIRGKITQYVLENLEDGVYVDRTEHLIGIMVWDAWRIRKNGLA